MVKVLNFGSLNIDFVYKVTSIVRPGETISSRSCRKYPGGKGLNQSIALARGNVPLFHGGIIGSDGVFLKRLLEEEKVDTRFLKVMEGGSTGSAFIQVADNGENSIVLSGGTNLSVDKKYISHVLSHFGKGDILVLQNEISCMKELLETAGNMGMRIFFNPAPMTEEVFSFPLEKVDTLIVNDTEYEALASAVQIPEGIALLVTRGGKGASYRAAKGSETFNVPAFPVEKVVDTTAAGDTFTGFFIAGLYHGKSLPEALAYAAKAASLCVTRQGAAPSIPFARELEQSEQGEG